RAGPVSSRSASGGEQGQRAGEGSGEAPPGPGHVWTVSGTGKIVALPVREEDREASKSAAAVSKSAVPSAVPSQVPTKGVAPGPPPSSPVPLLCKASMSDDDSHGSDDGSLAFSDDGKDRSSTPPAGATPPACSASSSGGDEYDIVSPPRLGRSAGLLAFHPGSASAYPRRAGGRRRARRRDEDGDRGGDTGQDRRQAGRGRHLVVRLGEVVGHVAFVGSLGQGRVRGGHDRGDTRDALVERLLPVRGAGRAGGGRDGGRLPVVSELARRGGFLRSKSAVGPVVSWGPSSVFRKDGDGLQWGTKGMNVCYDLCVLSGLNGGAGMEDGYYAGHEGQVGGSMGWSFLGNLTSECLPKNVGLSGERPVNPFLLAAGLVLGTPVGRCSVRALSTQDDVVSVRKIDSKNIR
ncbi:hypothetical protein THAOC_35429, partial [Thalassiosira oceanica]